MALTQRGRLISIKVDGMGDDDLLLQGFVGTERISQLYTFELDLLKEDIGSPVQFDQIIGKRATMTVDLGNDEERYLDGFVSRFVLIGSEGGRLHYKAELVPWLWLLTKTANSRIFQDTSVSEIIRAVFDAYSSIKDYDDQQLNPQAGAYPKKDYCVQYRESDFQFVSRLMEEHGIFYYFTHEKGQHTLVLGDEVTSLIHAPRTQANSGSQSTGPLQIQWGPSGSGAGAYNVIRNIRMDQELTPGTVTVWDYEWNPPTVVKPQPEPTVVNVASNQNYEVYDYPGGFKKVDPGNKTAKIRMEAIESGHLVVSGRSTAGAFATGHLFTLAGYPSPGSSSGSYNKYDLNQTFFLTEVKHSSDVGDTYSPQPQANPRPERYRNRFKGIPEPNANNNPAYRPERVTPRPTVQGSQTAKVLGPDPATKQPHLDKHGRVKVQFHWDRRNSPNSAYIRVSHIWAGDCYGGLFIPHRDQEVIVDFLEGNPDRPIITGRVYNPSNPIPPEIQPDGNEPPTWTQNIIRDQGGNYIKMEGKSGDEEIYLYSPGDITQKTDGDWTHEVKGASFEYFGGIRLGINTAVENNFFLGLQANQFIGAQHNFTTPYERNVFWGLSRSGSLKGTNPNYKKWQHLRDFREGNKDSAGKPTPPQPSLRDQRKLKKVEHDFMLARENGVPWYTPEAFDSINRFHGTQVNIFKGYQRNIFGDSSDDIGIDKDYQKNKDDEKIVIEEFVHGKKITFLYGEEITHNLRSFDQIAEEEIKFDSQTEAKIVGGGGEDDTAELHLNGNNVVLEYGNKRVDGTETASKITILCEDGPKTGTEEELTKEKKVAKPGGKITIDATNNCQDVEIKAKNILLDTESCKDEKGKAITLKAKTGITLEAKDITFNATEKINMGKAKMYDIGGGNLKIFK